MDYSKLSDDDKQTLAGLCRIEIKRWKRVTESNPNMRYMVGLMEIALASLSAQPSSEMKPVKAPKQERGTYPPARIKQARDMEWIMAIRDAGGTVQESE